MVVPMVAQCKQGGNTALKYGTKITDNGTTKMTNKETKENVP